MIFGRLPAWAVADADVTGAMVIFRVIAGLGVGGVMAAAFFWLLLHVLERQGANYREELRIVRKERAEDIARLERRLDQLYARLGMPPDREGVADDELP